MDKSFIKKVRLKDRIATRVITIGGMVIIACVIAILLLIAKVSFPLFMHSKAKLLHQYSLDVSNKSVLAVGIDDYQETGYFIDSNGVFTFIAIADGKVIKKRTVREDKELLVRSIDTLRNGLYSILWDDSSANLVKVVFQLDFDQTGKRTVKPDINMVRQTPALAAPAPSTKTQLRLSEEDLLTRADLIRNNQLLITQQISTTNLFGDESLESFTFLISEELPGTITSFTLNEEGSAIFAGTDNGYLLRWDLSEPGQYERTDTILAVADKKPITSLAMVLGDISIAVGDATGALHTWMEVRTEATSNIKKLRKIHTLASHEHSVQRIIPSLRNKTIMSLDQGGYIHFDHITSENHLIRILEPVSFFGSSDRGNGLIGINKDSFLLVWDIDNPHPEVNLKTLFGSVWYENYNKPEFVWQSSSGSDDFEPKLSIIPLLFGTIKGTIYAMIFAVPLAILGAIYTSQFANSFFKYSIKPVIEIMASVPSVVIGFLIALWLAPIIEKTILAVLLSLLIVPGVFIISLALLKPFYKNNRFREVIKGHEFLAALPIIFLGGAISYYIGPVLETFLFNGSFKLWLFHDLNMTYDQRNCIIIAFGLGIAVIPIIFSITDDAISNIPPSLSAASLALGASRWQTVWRVVLPSASPGIFAATMIGFGRAVGETMIVLMATGNTPVLDWSIFNGMRTMSANIAVEIPEAPFGGTLYRVLFLSATLLFGLTFILNTGAEIVRERLRKKYGRY